MKFTAKKQVLSVHYLRGIAASLVVLYHMRSYLNNVYSQPNLGEILLKFGAFGVDLFFIISGFIICLSTEKQEVNYLKNFVIRRFFRIYPMLIISVLVYYFLIYPNSDWILLVRSLIPLHQNYNEPGPGFGWNMMIPAWTITYEIVFYLIFMLGMSISFKYRSIVTAILIVLIFCLSSYGFNHKISLVTSHHNIYPNIWGIKPFVAIMTSPMLINFIYGIILYSITKRLDPPKNKTLLQCINAVLVLIIPICISLLFSNQLGGHGPQKWGMLSLIILFSAILLEKFNGLKEYKLLIILGNISYALYITHEIVLRYVREVSFFQSMNGFSKMTLVFSITLLVGYLCYVLIEKPFISIGRKLIKK